jgi:hypothetical protein
MGQGRTCVHRSIGRLADASDDKVSPNAQVGHGILDVRPLYCSPVYPSIHEY